MIENGLYTPSNGTTGRKIPTPTDNDNDMDIDIDSSTQLPPRSSEDTLLEISKLIIDSPRIKLLDSISCTHNPLYENIITNYIENNVNFRKNPRLSNPTMRNHLIELIRNVFGRSSILFAIDVEAWEFSTETVTEIGIAIYDPREQQVSLVPSTIHIHIRIKENLNKTNGRYVPNHAMNFNGNITYIMSQTEAVYFTQSLVNYYFSQIQQTGYSCYLVGHDVKGDVKWMNSLGVNFPTGYQTIDTNHLCRISHGRANISLKKALEAVDIPYAYLHNAGNDAYYTLLLAMKLCDPQSRVRYGLDIFVPDENQQMQDSLTPEEKKARKEEKKARKEANRKARLDARSRGEEYIPPSRQKQEQDKTNSPKKKRKKLPRGVTCEAIELNSALEATSVIFR